MNTIYSKRRRFFRPLALLLTVLLTLPFFTACGVASSKTAALPPPVDDTAAVTQTHPSATPANQQKRREGLSTGQKVTILVGAAALYYLYNQHKHKQEQGSEGKYYLSKNGRVYYRDAEGRAHWVTPPPEGIRVSESEAEQYRDFQGYNGRTTGRGLTDLQPAPGTV